MQHKFNIGVFDTVKFVSASSHIYPIYGLIVNNLVFYTQSTSTVISGLDIIG